MQSYDDPEREKYLVHKIMGYKVDGLIVSTTKPMSDRSHFNILKQNHVPYIFFDCIPPQGDFHFVICDIENGTVDIINFLLKNGHRCIRLLNGHPSTYASKEREKGYYKALTKNRLKIGPSLIVSCDLSESGTIKALNKLLTNTRHPTAIVTFNDNTALYALKYINKICSENKKDKIEFVSYANLPALDYLRIGPKASLELFPHKQGEKATEILLDIIRQKKEIKEKETLYYNVYIDPKLIIKY